MNSRERVLGVLRFEAVDRLPLVEWDIRGATMRRWIGEGYPEGVPPEHFFDLDAFSQAMPVNLGMHPFFEEKVLEKTDRYKIWQDPLGAVRKDFAEDEAPGFVTRSWLSFPVRDRESFREMQKRYLAADPARLPDNFTLRARRLADGCVCTHLVAPFLFWTARDWVGFENLCMLFYDDPALVHEMFTFITDFCMETLAGRIDEMEIDLVELKEDMAYKGAPMISPEMFREFMAPHYTRFIHFLKSHGAKLVFVDCDGFPGGLIPAFIDTGVDAMSPVEIAAGNDPRSLRAEYPRFGMMGGIDKRVLAANRRAIYDEVMGKVPCLMDRGGFIPHIDHAIPHDVPLENYQYYRKLLTRVVYGQSVEGLLP